jgi:hypothetical protein
LWAIVKELVGWLVVYIVVMGGKGRKKQHHAPKRSPNQAAYHAPVDEEALMAECLGMHELLINRTAALRTLETGELCYLLSCDWLREWKEYVGYSQFTGDEENQNHKHKRFGKKHPGKINTDIIAPLSESRDFYPLPAELDDYAFMGELVSEKKTKNEDYIPVTA